MIAGDERAEPDPLGHAGEVAERRVALEHVLPLAPDLRDLEEVVHHPQAREAGLLGRARDVGERRRAVVAGWPGQSKRETCRPNSSVIGSSCWRAAASGAVRNAGGTSSTGPARVHGRRSPRRRARSATPAGLAQLARRRPWPAPGAPRARLRSRTTVGRRVEHDRVGGHAVALGQRAPGRAAPGARARSSRPPSSARARRRLATIRSSTSNASRLARWSRSPAPTTARRRSEDTTWSGVEPLAPPSATCPPRSRRRARRGTGPAGAASLVDHDVGRRVQPQHLRAGSSAPCPPGRRA